MGDAFCLGIAFSFGLAASAGDFAVSGPGGRALFGLAPRFSAMAFGGEKNQEKMPQHDDNDWN